MARSGYLPRGLAKVNHRFKTPHWSVVAGGLVSFIALLTGTTSQVIILSVLGAVVMYLMSMVSLFMLRRQEPALKRPFVAQFYPVFPAIALFLSALCLIAIVYYNLMLSGVFFAGLLLAVLVFMLKGKHKEKIMNDVLLEQSALIRGGE